MLPNNPNMGGFAPNSYSGTMPFRFGTKLPAKPNPLASTQPAQRIEANPAGIQQAMNKRGETYHYGRTGKKPSEDIVDNPIKGAVGTQATAKFGASSCGSSMHTSAAGEGKKKYKVDAAADAKGHDAFKSLDDYMKKAGLNSFQANFFGRLINEGFNIPQLHQAIKQAEHQFGEKVAADLHDGLTKLEKSAFASLAPFAKNIIPNLGKARNLLGGAAGEAKNIISKVPFGTVADKAKNLIPDASKVKTLFDTAKSRGLNPFGAGSGTGFLTGALNPHTGAFNPDSEGNYLSREYLTRVLGSGAAGGLATRVGGKPLQDMATRMRYGTLSGMGAGGTLDVLRGWTGYNPNNDSKFTNLGQYAGFYGGIAPKSKPVIDAINKYEPVNLAMSKAMGGASSAMSGIKDFAKKNPVAAAAGLGTAGVGAGTAYGLNRINNTIADQALQGRAELNQYANQIQDQIGNNPLSQAGDFFKNNSQWLLPLLLMGGGYAAGGPMGGFSLPLMYLMMQNPQLLSQLTGMAPTANANTPTPAAGAPAQAAS
jgi:hypothetical protein